MLRRTRVACPYLLALAFVGAFCTPAPAQPEDTTSSSRPDALDAVLSPRHTDRSTALHTAEALTRLATRPMNVNRASASDLSALPSLSPALARRIVRHRTEEGPYASLKALTTITGIDAPLLTSIRPYLTASPPPDDGFSWDTVLDHLDVEILQRATRSLDLGRGFADDPSGTTFQGSPGRFTTRLRLDYKSHLHLALTLDQDPGEALRWRPRQHQYGFDHVAGNLTLRDVGPLQTLILGDYSAQFGQGVALWRGLTFGKGGNPVSPLIRSGRGLVPFQSTSEQRFFRGAAAQVALTPAVSVSAFVSRRRRDASLRSPDSTRARRPARTLSSGGLHRTPSALDRRDALGITTSGGALTYRTDRVRIGTTGYWSRLGRPLRPPSTPDRRYALDGTHTSMLSVFGSAALGSYTLFGEVARAETGRYGGLVGAGLNYDGRIQALLLARRYPRSFPGLYNAAVGESGDTQNEVGFYTGLRLHVAPDWHVQAYVDQYRFPWLRHGVPRPSRGLDTQLALTYTPRPWLSSEIEVEAEREETGVTRRGPGGRSLDAVATTTRQSAQWDTEYAFSDALSLRTQVQAARVEPPSTDASYGFLFAQGLSVQPTPSLELNAQVTLFDTDGYASRLYAYEHDLLYSFSVPAFYGEGRRSYLLAQYAPVPSLTVEAKYGVTWYPHRETIGSGLTATSGPHSREIRLQVRWTP